MTGSAPCSPPAGKHLDRHKALLWRIRRQGRAVEYRMHGDQFLLDG